MKYRVVRNKKYDYIGQPYASIYPNLHKYPATMLPQISVDILKEFKAVKGKLLDPYCGSGPSFASGLEYGLSEMYGFDINPLAVLISKVDLFGNLMGCLSSLAKCCTFCRFKRKLFKNFSF
jgi:hypothetical protein